MGYIGIKIQGTGLGGEGVWHPPLPRSPPALMPRDASTLKAWCRFRSIWDLKFKA
jgi:hypothetical protein